MSVEDAKAYLATRDVPRLFECLMTGLMFHRPNDHIQYLIDSLEKVKVKGQDAITWNMFVEARSAKTPLPPITPDNGRRPLSGGYKKEGKRSSLTAVTSPLPPISSRVQSNVRVIFVMGGPCSGKSLHVKKLAEKYPGWVTVHLGEVLRREIKNRSVEERWWMVKKLVVDGELAPEEITLNLLKTTFKNNVQAKGFIIDGFPRNMEQAQAFEKTISHVDAVLLLDCEEESLVNNSQSRANKTERLDETPDAFARRLLIFKEQTLPVLKHYDDMGKLYIVDGDQEEGAVHDLLSVVFEELLENVENDRRPSLRSSLSESRLFSGRQSRKSVTPTAPSRSPSPSSQDLVTLKLPDTAFVPPPTIKVQDEGRKSDLPEAPIIFFAGGPGSGKGTQCAKVTSRYPDIVHLSMGDTLRKEISDKGSADDKWRMIMKLVKQGDMAPVDVTEELLIRSMSAHPHAKAYLVEGYPRDALQYENFNRNIGGHSFTILLDCESQYLHDRLVLRGGSGNDRIDDNIHAIERKLEFFAKNTLPLLKAIEDEKKLIVIDGDRDEDEIFYDIVKCLDFSLYGVELEEGKASAEDSKEEEDDKKQEVVEKEIVAESSTPTFSDEEGSEHSIRVQQPPAPISMANPAELDDQEEEEELKKEHAESEDKSSEESSDSDSSEEEAITDRDKAAEKRRQKQRDGNVKGKADKKTSEGFEAGIESEDDDEPLVQKQDGSNKDHMRKDEEHLL